MRDQGYVFDTAATENLSSSSFVITEINRNRSGNLINHDLNQQAKQNLPNVGDPVTHQ